MSKAILIIDMPEHCYECLLEYHNKCTAFGDLRVESLDRPKWCPLKECKEAIPVEWLKQLLNNAELPGQPYTINILKRILSSWEEENKEVRQ